MAPHDLSPGEQWPGPLGDLDREVELRAHRNDFRDLDRQPARADAAGGQRGQLLGREDVDFQLERRAQVLAALGPRGRIADAAEELGDQIAPDRSLEVHQAVAGGQIGQLEQLLAARIVGCEHAFGA